MKNRYIPFTQQPYCCTPTCIQMIMYKNGIPLRSQEDIGYAIGLTVPNEDAHLFNKVRTGEKPPAGWGTQISNPKYELNSALKNLEIPLSVELRLISSIESADELKEMLAGMEKSDGDAALCFSYGHLWDKDTDSGHVCVFDSVEGESIWMVDPERSVPKYRQVNIEKLYGAMKAHGDAKSGGVWIFTRNNMVSR